jgi:hypothetical protein
MENKKLAIKGHPTRGNEVLEILEMLGGKNGLLGGGNKNFIYCIKPSNDYIMVEDINNCNLNEFTIFTLEEFLEKYPYKIGDKVQDKGSASYEDVYIIEDMIWEDNQIHYVVYNPWQEYDKCTVTVTAEDLQPYEEGNKEEDNTNIHINPDIDNKTTCDIKINGMKVNINDYTVKSITKTDDGLIVEYIKNKPQYPKTYEECYAILNQNLDEHSVIGYRSTDVYNLQLLLICRDAYWKIASEEMGLFEPWKPYANDEGKTHSLYYNRYTDSIDKCEGLFESNAILDFPTKEMRDAFFENFKDLIEKCKEFL